MLDQSISERFGPSYHECFLSYLEGIILIESWEDDAPEGKGEERYRRKLVSH